MALNPNINQNYAGVSFSPTWGAGEIPVVGVYTLDALPLPNSQVYKNGTLLAQSTATDGNLVIYDSTKQATNPFKGVFFDEMAPATIAGVEPEAVEVAIADRPSTLWLHSNLNGANSGSTDINYLITNGYANVVYRYVNGVKTKYVQFKGMGTGA